jgi:hypothetical protein
MNRGEKLFFGTIIASTFVGTTVAYANAEGNNNAPIETVVDAGIALREANDELAATIASLPLCGNTVVTTLQSTEFIGSLATSSIDIIKAECTDGSESTANISALTQSFENQQSANDAYATAIDENEFSLSEKFYASTAGFVAGWIAGWAIALSGYSVNNAVTDYRSKRRRGSTITG